MSPPSQPHIPPRSDNALRIVMIGDIVGKPGVRVACSAAGWLKQRCQADLVIANAENAADGSGLRCAQFQKLIDAGIDGITLGDHVFRKREIIEVLQTQPNIVRPANLPVAAPGATRMLLPTSRGPKVAVMCALGRVFMGPVDSPFEAVQRQLDQLQDQTVIRLLDFHAEATSDMQIMGRLLDGQVSAVLGTHTHVATADEQLLPGGTGFQSDVGMTGPFQSILGRKIDAVLEHTLTGLPVPFQVATGNVRLNATWFDADLESGHCRGIGRINVSEQELKDLAAA